MSKYTDLLATIRRSIRWANHTQSDLRSVIAFWSGYCEEDHPALSEELMNLLEETDLHGITLKSQSLPLHVTTAEQRGESEAAQ